MILSILQAGDGLTFGEVVRDIPHDMGALVAYVLIAAFVGFIWYGSRSSGGSGSSSQPPADG